MSQSLFDRKAKTLQLSRALRRAHAAGQGHALYLHHEIAGDIAERLQVFSNSFDRVLVLRDLNLDWRALLAPKAGQAQIDVLATPPLDVAELKIEPESYDLIIAPLNLHWVQALPDLLLALRFALRGGGLLIGAMFGGESLIELKRCLAESEDALTGGVHARTSPVVDLRSLASLMQGAGFAQPVADLDRLPLRYASAIKLMKDLSDAGEGNALATRSKAPMSRALMMHTAQVYHQRYQDDEGLIPVTCDVLHFSGSRQPVAPPIK